MGKYFPLCKLYFCRRPTMRLLKKLDIEEGSVSRSPPKLYVRSLEA